VAASITVGAAPLTPTPATPILTSLGETVKTWREGNALARIAASKKRKPPIGTTFSVGLNEPATVTFVFTTTVRGRRVGRMCVAPTNSNRRKLRKKRPCTRTVKAGTLTFSAHAGTNTVRFDGLISKHKKLKPGSYTLSVTALASGKHSATGTLHFKIIAG
jgi:methionine-rich copper-binding protein CopC